MVKKCCFSKCKNILFVAFMLVAVWSCDDPNELGMDLLPTSDLFSAGSFTDSTSIQAYTFSEELIRTDENAKSLLGSLVDPVFGKTNINMAGQFRLGNYPEFGTEPVVDSLFLFLFYRNFYGDTLTPVKLKVYELTSPLDVNSKYYQDENFMDYVSTSPIGEGEFIPKVSYDTASTTSLTDTLVQRIKIVLDNSLAQKLITADTLDMVNNDVFLEFFKGLLIDVEPVDDNGSIVSLENIQLTSSQVGMGVLFLEYHNAEEDSLSQSYLLNTFSARVNSFQHDYSGTPFISEMDKTDVTDSLIYIQSTGGVRSKLFIPNFDSWKDSVDLAINKAEIIFQIDSIASGLDQFSPPNQLLLTIVEDDGTELLPLDYSFSPALYGGYLNSVDKTYRFNITQHMQEVVNGSYENNGFYLGVADKNAQMTRVVLKGSGSQTGIKLNVTYSKINQ